MAGQKKRSLNQKALREPIPPDGGYGWVVLFACFVISFVIDGCMYSIGIVLPEIKNHFGVSQEKANLLSSLNTGFMFCSGPIVSGLSNQFGARLVVMGGAIVTGLMYLISAYSSSIYFMMIAYGIVGGISTGCTYIASLIIIADYFDKLKGVTTGITMSGSGFGAFAFAPISQILISNFDWQTTLIVLASVILQCCVMGALLRPVPTRLKQIELKSLKNSTENPQSADNNNNLKIQSFAGSIVSIQRFIKEEEESDTSDSSCCKNCLNVSSSIIKQIFDLKLLTQSFMFFLITMSNFFIFMGYFIPFLYIPIRAKEIGLTNYGWVLSVIGIVNIPSRLAFGALADKRVLSPINLNTLAAFIGALSLWSFSFMNTFWSQCIFAVLFATGIGGMNCLCTPYLTDIVGKAKFSNGFGIVNLFRGFACFIGPFVGGYLSDQFKSSLVAFWFSAICFTLGFIFSGIVSIGDKLNCKNSAKNDERRYNSV